MSKIVQCILNTITFNNKKSRGLILQKNNTLINDWVPLKDLSNAKQKLQNKTWIIKGVF